MKRRSTGLVLPLLILLLCLCSSPVHADPPEHARWQPIPELTDEFDGDQLDLTKWHDHNPQWKGRKPGLFSKKNVTVRDGKLHLTARAEDLPDLPEGYHTFTTAAVKSKALVKYGYFEIKCRPMKSRASSAFWFYHSTPEIWTEIDVFEIGGGAPGHERTVHMNVHVFHTPTEKKHWSKSGRWDAPFDLADGDHVYALEWDRDQIKYYVDGQVKRTLENTHWHQPLSMNFDSETMPDWFGLPKVENLPSTFSIEYVRSWKRIDDGKKTEQAEATSPRRSQNARAFVPRPTLRLFLVPMLRVGTHAMAAFIPRSDASRRNAGDGRFAAWFSLIVPMLRVGT